MYERRRHDDLISHPMLAWSLSPDDEARFAACATCCWSSARCCASLLRWLPRPKEDRPLVAELPPQMAEIVLERAIRRRRLRRRPAKVAKKAEEQPANAQPDQARKRPEARAGARSPACPRRATRSPTSRRAKARRRAAQGRGVGLLAMKDQLAEIRGAPVAVQLNQNIKPGPGVGTGAGAGVGAGNEPACRCAR